MKHKKVILSSAVLLFVAITGFCFYVNLIFSNPEFRYGDFNYWLFTDKEFRNFPIIGSEPKDVLYQSSFQDGTKPGMLTLEYDTHLNPSEVIKAYQSVCHELNYLPKLTDYASHGILVYSGRGRYERIEIIVEKNRKNGSNIKVNFIMKFEN
jgi:hypothetical protein